MSRSPALTADVPLADPVPAAQAHGSGGPVLQGHTGTTPPAPQAGRVQPAVPSQSRLRAIDGLRALAMLMVFSYHSWKFGDSPALRVGLYGHAVALGRIFDQFPAGVDLFMVLSGFCLFWPICKDTAGVKWRWQDYAQRRVRRIVPPYYAAIVYVTLLPIGLVAVYRVLHLPAHWQALPSLRQYLTHLVFIHTLFPGTWAGLQGAFWSLGLEAQFYVAFPFVVWAYRRVGMPVAWMMVGTSIVYRMSVAALVGSRPWPVPFLFSVFFPGRWMQFAAGMLAAWLVADRRRRDSGWSGLTGTGLLLGAAALYAAAVGPADRVSIVPLRDLLLALAYGAAIVALCATATAARALFENRVITWLGFISYSIFLLHQNTVYYFGELLKKIMHLDGPARFAVMMTVGLIGVVGVSYLFFLVFERPFVNERARSGAAVASTWYRAAALVRRGPAEESVSREGGAR